MFDVATLLSGLLKPLLLGSIHHFEALANKRRVSHHPNLSLVGFVHLRRAVEPSVNNNLDIPRPVIFSLLLILLLFTPPQVLELLRTPGVAVYDRCTKPGTTALEGFV